MMLPIKRTFAELIKLYELEPKTCDLLVEGPADKTILSDFLYLNGLQNKIYHSDQIDFGKKVNNKREVIVEAASRFRHHGRIRSFGVIDADVSTYLEERLEHDNLLMTDYTSLEIYPLSFSTIERHIRLAHHFSLLERDYQFGCRVARFLFACRILKERNGWQDGFPDVGRNLTLMNGGLFFNLDEFIKSTESKNACPRRWTERREDIDAIVETLVHDDRFNVNVHDLSEILTYIVRLRTNRNLNLAGFPLEKMLRTHFNEQIYGLDFFTRLAIKAA